MPALHSLAAAENAEWCDLVCRTHGLDGVFGEDAWTSPVRTPRLYPDAVTLVPGRPVRALLDRVDCSPGCSIKDSFASLDLTPFGFRVRFDADWIVRRPAAPPPVAAGPKWRAVQDAGGFDAWERAWRGEDGPRGVLLVDLLRQSSVRVLAAHASDRVVAGAILHRSSEVVGISNFFADADLAETAWGGCLELADALFPASTFVGYESGAALAATRRHGFEPVGPLRVWVFEEGATSGYRP